MLNGSTIAEFLRGTGPEALRHFLEQQRWFAGKGRGIERIHVEDWASLRTDPPLLLLLIEVDGDRYYVPLSGRVGLPPSDPSGEHRTAPGASGLVDAHRDPDLGRSLLLAMEANQEIKASRGSFRFHRVGEWAGPPAPEIRAMPIHPLAGEQSNTSLRVGDSMILKSFRRPRPGINPDFEVTHFLTTRTSFPHAPGLIGWADYEGARGDTATVAVLQRFVASRGDGWSHGLEHLQKLRETLRLPPRAADARDGAPEPSMAELAGPIIEEMRQLGVITGELHVALASDPSVEPFRPEPITEGNVERWRRAIERDAAETLTELRERAPRLPEPVRAAVAPLLAGMPRLEGATAPLSLLAGRATYRIRCHGDYHLGQVLKTATGFVVIDFEGEPARPVEERRAKHSPLRDVAGMLRSFDYVVHAAQVHDRASAVDSPPSWLETWRRLVAQAFRDAYAVAARRSPVRLVPESDEELDRVVAVFELEKALYELRYEMAHRPDWIPIAAAGISRILSKDRHHG